MWREFWNIYWKRLIGAAAGLFFGFIYLAAGFWDMLFVALLVYAGYWVGKLKEQGALPVVPWQRIWQTVMDRFRPFR
ncbi:DUF2273 domain-containing protein [Paenibacillus sp. HB172176]|uniref:DUF2273 domain-containing protein n=1 Tax=Paenibacillus sp. HB172176 TaxID=2493690 RepID=UPI00143B222E|nr:DUF2273 domain-containing protein [Paenibacillus sp. HB172176]